MAEPTLPLAPTADQLEGAKRAMAAAGDTCALWNSLQWFIDGAAQVSDLDNRRAIAQRSLQDKDTELAAANLKIARAAEAAGMSVPAYEAKLEKLHADIAAATTELSNHQSNLGGARKELADIQTAINVAADDLRGRLPPGWVLTVPAIGPVIDPPHNGTVPVITLLGDNPLHMLTSETFDDPGATASDGSFVTVSGDDFPTDFAATVQVRYDASNSTGAAVTAIRNVEISDMPPPETAAERSARMVRSRR